LNGRRITYWNCANPKNYGCVLDNGDVKGKCKGFRVNAEAKEKMTFEERTKLINGEVNSVNINSDQFVIKTRKYLQSIWSRAGTSNLTNELLLE